MSASGDMAHSSSSGVNGQRQTSRQEERGRGRIALERCGSFAPASALAWPAHLNNKSAYLLLLLSVLLRRLGIVAI